MSLPFDLEDVVGVALASLLRRFLWLWSCLTVGWLLVAMAGVGVELGAEVWDLLTGGSWGGSVDLHAGELAFALLLGVFFSLGSSFAPLYAAFMLAMAFYAFKADDPAARVWGGGVGVTGLFTFAVRYESFSLLEGTVTALLWICLLLGVFFFAKWWAVLQRVRAEVHLMGVTVENQRKREEIRQRTGGAVADREFALGDVEDGE